MIASTNAATLLEPIFPEDIERTINEMLLLDARGMCHTMSLVASRFNVWTKPITFHTVIVRPHDNWVQRVRDHLLPNGNFIRILVLDLPFREGLWTRVQPSAEEVRIIQRLLEASRQTNHLAVSWNIWALLQRECGALVLESLYLIWDRALGIGAPSLDHLEHPLALKDLAIYAPHNCSKLMSRQSHGDYFLPRILAPNLEYVTYAADRRPVPALERLQVKGVTLVLLREEGHYWTDEERWIEAIHKEYPHFCITCLRYPHELLREWVAKAEGKKSVLRHSSDTATEPTVDGSL